MTEKRLIVDENYNIVDTVTDEWLNDNQIFDLVNELNDKNKQLKQTLRTYRKVANCRNCDYHDYDCRVEGDDFEVCDRGNDMSDYICEDWREL